MNMPTNFELKRLKLELDIVKKPENRVHELTGSISNVSRPDDQKIMILFIIMSPNSPRGAARLQLSSAA